MGKGEIHRSLCLQRNLYSAIPSSFSLPSPSSAKGPTRWFWDPEQLSAKPDTPNKQQNIAPSVHMGTTHKAIPLGMESYCTRLFRASLTLLVPFPLSGKFRKTSCTTCQGAHGNLSRRFFCVLDRRGGEEKSFWHRSMKCQLGPYAASLSDMWE